jgi:hypothetical protein
MENVNFNTLQQFINYLGHFYDFSRKHKIAKHASKPTDNCKFIYNVTYIYLNTQLELFLNTYTGASFQFLYVNTCYRLNCFPTLLL